ncbi:hypothetical protein Tsubulata_024819 [Turnera subulata]|uniref:Uncharacterized protein n=1 Tax=Turnera subulata TaxID=218843 RepID=A0A9Q0J3A7_9ROSI|nr:hypothetical protein Tsubulata_024819 [Turnera subulata]
MGRNKVMVEEKAPGYHYNRMEDESLEDEVSVFLHEDFDGSTRSFEDEEEDDYESDAKNLHDPEERTLFWESQEALIQELLDHYNSTGSKFRQEISRIIGMAKKTDFCNFLEPSRDGCISCLRRRVVKLLSQKGFIATLCTSEWKHSRKLPGGRHEYIEVIASTSGSKKQVPYLIELEFRDQFRIAKACDEYHRLVALLPEYYIGKPKYLNAIIGVLCDAASRSMKEKKIHMGPWRKRGFMQMKWSGSTEKREEESARKFSQFPSEQENDSCLQFRAPPPLIVT